METHDQLREEVLDGDPTTDTPADHQETAETPPGDSEYTEDSPHHTEVAAINEQLLSKTEELHALNDKYLRLAAEFENYKRRAQRDHRQAVQFANESLLRDILPTLDNLERAIASAEACQGQPEQELANINGLLEGMNLTRKHFLNTLQKMGVQAFESLQEMFDPARHQAIGHVAPAPDVPGNSIVAEHQKGYFLHDRILRPAMVTVAQPPKEGAES